MMKNFQTALLVDVAPVGKLAYCFRWNVYTDNVLMKVLERHDAYKN